MIKLLLVLILLSLVGCVKTTITRTHGITEQPMPGVVVATVEVQEEIRYSFLGIGEPDDLR